MSATTSASTQPDLTRHLESSTRPWISIPGLSGQAKIICVDEVEKQVIFMFKFEPNSTLLRHKHHCFAIAYTISGEWEYEEGLFKAGDIAYEPFESDHTPASKNGGILLAILRGRDDNLLENFLPDGSSFMMDINFFKLLEGMTPEQAAAIKLPGMA
jgi:anti-sigma factor ChrR (cupin superfamily)